MPSPPEWLQELADAVALQMTPADVLAPVGCHFCLVDGTWEISLFAAGTQIVGGKKDGVVRASRFSVDLQSLVKHFSEIESFSWQALRLSADDEEFFDQVEYWKTPVSDCGDDRGEECKTYDEWVQGWNEVKG